MRSNRSELSQAGPPATSSFRFVQASIIRSRNVLFGSSSRPPGRTRRSANGSPDLLTFTTATSNSGCATATPASTRPRIHFMLLYTEQPAKVTRGESLLHALLSRHRLGALRFLGVARRNLEQVRRRFAALDVGQLIGHVPGPGIMPLGQHVDLQLRRIPTLRVG